jgi:hypothetical protein
MPTANFTTSKGSPNTTISSTVFNAFIDALEAILNGLDSDNVGTNGFGAAAHGNLSAITTTMHTGSSVVIVDTANYYTGATVELALAEVALFVGLAATPVATQFFDYEATTANSCEITIPANSCPRGVILHFACNIGSPTGNTFMPLEMNIDGVGWVALDATLSNPEFNIGMGSAGGNAASFYPFTLASTPAWQPTKEIKFRFGTAYVSSGNLGTCSNFKLLAQRIMY